MVKGIAKPPAYRMSARSRADIVAAIMSMSQKRAYDHHAYGLCFNVKVYTPDLSLKNLLRHWRNADGDSAYTHNPRWLKDVAERYAEHAGSLFEWGTEGACRYFTDDISSTFRELWDGTKVSVEYGFAGRSGGWLVILEFEGYSFVDRGIDVDERLMGMDYPTLRKLYQLILMLNHDLSRDKRDHEVEYQAAFCFFANICCDIYQEDAAQLDLFRTQEEIEQDALQGRYPDDDYSKI